jgi:tRNA (guanine37-N1)-methyltransferase
MRIDVVSIFPAMFEAVSRYGITGRAHERGLWQLGLHNPRDFTTDPYRRVDDRPYGGGPGMVMLAEPLALAIGSARVAASASAATPAPVIALSPQGSVLDDRKVRDLAGLPAVILVAGRYEGIDQRLIDRHVDEEVSIGDFVVSGGELPAMILIDAMVRWLPGAMQDAQSVAADSFGDGLLDCPHYTRPEVFESAPVPPVLLSGHHANIARWRRERSLEATMLRRPDLIERARRAGRLNADDEAFLRRLSSGKNVASGSAARPGSSG